MNLFFFADLLKDLVKYQKLTGVEAAATNKFRNHVRYLSEVNIAMLVFDELSLETRQGLVDGILGRPGKADPPVRREIQSEDISKLSLSGLTTTNSLKFFERSGIESDFFPHYVN